MRSTRQITELRNISINPRRHKGGGVDATPLRFFWNIFFVNRLIVTIFPIAFRPSFLRPL